MNLPDTAFIIRGIIPTLGRRKPEATYRQQFCVHRYDEHCLHPHLYPTSLQFIVLSCLPLGTTGSDGVPGKVKAPACRHIQQVRGVYVRGDGLGRNFETERAHAYACVRHT